MVLLTKASLGRIPSRVSVSSNLGNRFKATNINVSSKNKNYVAIRTNLKGDALLNTPRLNKGAAFTREERSIFGLEGMLPYEVHDLDVQCKRAWAQLEKQPTVLLKHAFLASLRDQNQVLFYRLMSDHLKELLGVLYTPGAAEAVSNYSALFRRPTGCYISFPNADGMAAQLKSHLYSLNRQADLNERAGEDDSKAAPIDLIVVTDSEAILGIGDQGVGGITISTSKAALYTLGAGINPNRILPVVLDVGTDNHALFSDPLYMGWKRTRIRGKIYDEFIDKFIKNCKALFPDALIHFEDFGLSNAQRLLDKYADEIPCFNDDIQGTGAVTLSALMAAVGITKSTLADQRIVVYGAGSAGMGIARQIRDGMVLIDGLTQDEANARFWCVDRNGLLVESMGDSLRHSQLQYARPDAEVADWPREDPNREALRLMDVVRAVKPTVLIGTSTHQRAFNEELVKEMASHVERPIIFPMSNPTSLAEVDPADAFEWTGGRALLATGSPFPPCRTSDGKTYVVAQTNNALIYPALGLGAIVSKSRTLSPGMFSAGVQALASLSPALKDPQASLLPDLSEVRSVSVAVATAVVKQAVDEGNSRVPQLENMTLAEIEEFIRARVWDPVYRPLELMD
ncbi:malate dehydrogenase [Phaffia rhodozyma]|uniref:Malic enzyme n=1 Tax=Phaffia rhodozyma TaxID=264483 RepID=A0A0F7SWB5_PHARH|nr:malate dehydrogenase [Phaffia rhodozyma]